MIKKSILFCGIVLGLWSLVLRVAPVSITLHSMQDNIAKAEKFIFDMDTPENLIVGSSISTTIHMDSLPEFYNLSLSGQSAFDGLNLLREKKNLPTNVFIEMNVLIRSENSVFKESISSPVMNTMKEHVSAFRTDKQVLPAIIGYVLTPSCEWFRSAVYYRGRGWLEAKFKALKNKLSHHSENIGPSHKPRVLLASLTSRATDEAIEQDSTQGQQDTPFVKERHPMLDQMLGIQKKEYSSVNAYVINTMVVTLTDHVKFLKSKGVNVVFFEMPVNRELTSLERAITLRKNIIEGFPDCEFIPLPKNAHRYITRDGVHLAPEEAAEYSRYLSHEVVRIIEGGKAHGNHQTGR